MSLQRARQETNGTGSAKFAECGQNARATVTEAAKGSRRPSRKSTEYQLHWCARILARDLLACSGVRMKVRSKT